MNKKITFILLMVLFAMTARAYTYYDGIEIGNFRYNLALATSSSEESKATLQGLSSAGASATSLNITGYVTYNGNRYRVASIASNAFQYKTSVTSVRIGYGVEKIGNNVFKGCDALNRILLPSSINEIGNYAFQNCTALAYVCVAGDVAPTIFDNTFNNSSTTKKVSTATYRGRNAIRANSKWLAAFGGNANNIQRQTGVLAYDMKVGNLYYTIQNGIPYNFSGQNRSYCTIVYGDFSNDTKVTLGQNISFSSNNSPGNYHLYGVADSAFIDNIVVTQVVNNNTMANRIGIAAFRNCTSLQSVDVPVDTIANFAFYGCTNLYSAIFTSNLYNLVYLGSYAFGKCNLSSVTIPQATKYIGNAPFYDNSLMTGISVNANNTNYCSYYNALYNKSKTMLYQIPGNWQEGIFPETLQRVLPYAAAGYKFHSLTLPYNVKTLDQYAFQNSKNLETVHFPSSLTTVNANSFAGCDAINRVELNLETPPTIDYFPAVTDKSKVDLYIPLGTYSAYTTSSVWSQYHLKTSKYDYVNCWDILSGGLRYTVTSTSPYSYNGFSGDGTLRVVEIPGSCTIPSTINYATKRYVPTEIGSYAALNTTDNITISQAPTIIKIRRNAFEDTKLTNFPFINVEEIESEAFRNTTMLKIELTNLNKLTSISSSAFYNSGITKFVASTTLTEINEYAFSNCHNLHEIFLPHIYGVHPTIYGFKGFFGNNADDFKCWIDYRYLPVFLKIGALDTSKIYPHLVLDSKWHSFSCIKPISFEGIGLEVYTVTDYNPSDKKATLTPLTNLAAENGAVIHGEADGTYHRLNYAPNTGGATSEILIGNIKSETLVPNYGVCYFTLNPNRPEFNRVTDIVHLTPGHAYIRFTISEGSGVSTIYTNLSGTGGIPGDVNGDGVVTAADVTALYDYLLNNDTSHIVNGDQTGDNDITAADITAVYTVLLSN